MSKNRLYQENNPKDNEEAFDKLRCGENLGENAKLQNMYSKDIELMIDC